MSYRQFFLLALCVLTEFLNAQVNPRALSENAQRGLDALENVYVSGDCSLLELLCLQSSSVCRHFWKSSDAAAVNYRHALDTLTPNSLVEALLCVQFKVIQPPELAYWLTSGNGWTLERHGWGDWNATLLGLRTLLIGQDTAEALQKWQLHVVLDAIRVTSIQELADHTGSLRSLRQRLTGLRFLAELQTKGQLPTIADSIRLQDGFSALQEELLSLATLSPEDISLYDVALLINARCALGIQDDMLPFWHALLLQGQTETGIWQDTMCASDVLTTLCATEAIVAMEMQAAATTISWDDYCPDLQASSRVTDEPIPVSPIQQPSVLTVAYPDTFFKAAENWNIQAAITIRDTSGNDCLHMPISSENAIRLRIDDLPPGHYTLLTQFRDALTLTLLGELRHPLTIAAWHEPRSLKIVAAALPRELRTGSSGTLRPRIAITGAGNITLAGTLACQWLSPNGIPLLDYPARELILPTGDYTCELSLEEKDVHVTEPGLYRLAVLWKSQTGDVFLQDTLTFIVNDAFQVNIQNEPTPTVLPVNPTFAQVALKLTLGNTEAAAGIPAFYTWNESIPFVEDADDAPPVILTLTNIRNALGKRLQSGWIVCKVDYGHCTHALELKANPTQGTLTAHAIQNGECVIKYKPGGEQLRGVVPLKLYAGIGTEEHIEQLSELGVLQVMLTGYKRQWMVYALPLNAEELHYLEY